MPSTIGKITIRPSRAFGTSKSMTTPAPNTSTMNAQREFGTLQFMTTTTPNTSNMAAKGNILPTMLLPFHTQKHDMAAEPRQRINFDAFQADREVSTGEAIVYCLKTRQSINVNDPIQDLTQLKKSIKETAHSYLIKDILMTSKAVMLQDGTPIPSRSIDDLCEIWAKNSNMAEQMWTILVKRYEDMGDWELKFEEEVMASLNLEYVEEDTMEETQQMASKDVYGLVIHRKKSRIRGNKGCVAKVLTLVKRDIIKQFNRASSITHGNTITSVNPVIRHDTTTEPNLEVTEDD
jgi:hypothetical protein